MTATLEATRKNAIATKLADMKVLQNLMISNEQKLLSATKGEQRVTDAITDMLSDDRKSISAIETAITELEMSSQPSNTVTNLVFEHKLEMEYGVYYLLFSMYAMYFLYYFSLKKSR